MDPFLGELKVVPYDFAPRGWAICAGQLLPINQNQGLFSLLGTMYGGNGQTTFALPDLRGRVAISAGQGPGLSNYVQGVAGGLDAVALAANEIPAHSHGVRVASTIGTSANPSGKHIGSAPLGMGYVYGASPNDAMPAGTIANAGGSQPHNNHQPVLSLNYIIALVGVYPPR